MKDLRTKVRKYLSINESARRSTAEMNRPLKKQNNEESMQEQT
jgi:hypothetical protein